MSFDFFDIPKEEPKLKEVKKEIVKEECPYCGRKYANLNRHFKTCPQNPDRVVKAEPKPKKTPIQAIDEEKLRKEIREELLKSLTDEDKEKISLDSAEMEKIEEVIKFLGGTEGYQFIYKSITGDKIRGIMPHIIDECIRWLKMHKLFLLWHK